MKIILLAAAIAMVLAAATTRSSVGGPLAMLMIVVLAMLAVAIQEARTQQRGALGWAVNIVVALIAGFAVLSVFGMAMESVLPSLGLEGSLASTQHPILYVAAVGMAVAAVLGGWGALQLVNRWR